MENIINYKLILNITFFKHLYIFLSIVDTAIQRIITREGAISALLISSMDDLKDQSIHMDSGRYDC